MQSKRQRACCVAALLVSSSDPLGEWQQCLLQLLNLYIVTKFGVHT